MSNDNRKSEEWNDLPAPEPPAFFDVSPVLTLPITVEKVSEFNPTKQENLALHMLPDGSEYYGDILLDKPHGLGIIIFKSTSLMYGDGDRYGGRWANGQFHGEGVLKTSCFTYHGEFCEGKMSGSGKITYRKRPGDVARRGIVSFSQYEFTHPPKEYTGDFHPVYQRHGRGVLLYMNGDVYEGEFNTNCRHGRGCFKSSGGAEVYEGEWLRDEWHGSGQINYIDGGVFKGAFAHGKRDGEGTMIYPNGDEYTGWFTNDKIEGHGTMRYKNGDKYEGMWKGGLRHGEGKSTLQKLGATVEGTFVRGIIHGKGVVQHPGISTFVGEFDRGERRQGTLFWHRTPADGGLCYQGEWVGETRHGRGLMWYNNGDFYFGSFVKNMRHGAGNLRYADGSEYSGNFANDVREGEGLLQRVNGTIQAGTWSKDVLVDGYDGEWDGNAFNGAGSLVLRDPLQTKDKSRKGGITASPQSTSSVASKNEEAPSSGATVSTPLFEHFGVFCQGVRHGPGILRLGGHVIIGTWINDTLSCDSGSWEFPSGELYMGSFKDGLRNGTEGKMWFADGSYFFGDWRFDSPVGMGLYHGAKEIAHHAPGLEEISPSTAKSDEAQEAPSEKKSNPIALMNLFTTFFRNKTVENKEEQSKTCTLTEHYLLQGDWRPTKISYTSCQTLVTKCKAAASGASGESTSLPTLKSTKWANKSIGKPPASMFVGLQEGGAVVLFKSGVCVRDEWIQNYPRLRLPHRADAPFHGEICFRSTEKEVEGMSSSGTQPGKICAVCEKPFTFFRKEVKCAACDRMCCGSCLSSIEAADHLKLEALMRSATDTVEKITDTEVATVINTPTQLQACATCLEAVQLDLQFSSFWLPLHLVLGEKESKEDDGVEEAGSSISTSSLRQAGEVGETLPVVEANDVINELGEGAEENAPDRQGEEATRPKRSVNGGDEYVIYEGYMSHGVPHLFGSLWWGRDAYYVGGFKEGRKHGIGKEILANGECYKGEFANGNWNGEGAYLCLDGTAYAGTWENGTLKTIRYHGELDEEWRRHGRGQSYCTEDDDKTRYNGEWKHGLWHGTGLLQRSDGFVYSGEFTSGRIEGEGKLLLGGSVYYGSFVNGKQHGRGFELFSSEYAIIGEWRDGVLSGPVSVHDAITQSVYESTYNNGNERYDCFPVPVMVNDVHAQQCVQCNAAFTLFVRRHHCRLCGEVFCDGCSQRRATIPAHFKLEGQQRVCDRCFQRLECGCTLAIKRYGKGKEVYAGCWSQGQWVSRGLFLREDGSIIVTDSNGRPILDSSASTQLGEDKLPVRSSGLGALPPVEMLRELPASPNAEVEAFKLWWVVMTTTATLSVPLDISPIEHFVFPRPPQIKPPNLFFVLKSGEDKLAAGRAPDFKPPIAPPPPRFPVHRNLGQDGEIVTCPPPRPVITESSVFSRIADKCKEKFPMGPPRLKGEEEGDDNAPSRYLRKNLLPTAPPCPEAGTDDRIAWSDWETRHTPQYGGLAALASAVRQPCIPGELKHVPFACSFVNPVVCNADRILHNSKQYWKREPFKCPQEFTVKEFPDQSVVVLQGDKKATGE
uniref:FYVE-type domain-containing protein n=1 Tax=Trypanosoma congolense (strain IL3000) TaxID=1068625 RepID=G0UPB2_TRYCI|nr:conserved hypothetical protein [Trypanosoma congolense IL3000]